MFICVIILHLAIVIGSFKNTIPHSIVKKNLYFYPNHMTMPSIGSGILNFRLFLSVIELDGLSNHAYIYVFFFINSVNGHEPKFSNMERFIY